MIIKDGGRAKHGTKAVANRKHLCGQPGKVEGAEGSMYITREYAPPVCVMYFAYVVGCQLYRAMWRNLCPTLIREGRLCASSIDI